MLPSLTQPSLWVLLLLSVSNLLQWENVTCAPIHENKTEQGDVSLKDLFDHAITLSQTTSALTTEMRKLFVLDFFKDKMYMIKILNSCHTFSLNTPETVEEARDISFEDFLKMILSIVHSWNNPLHHLVTELGGMKGAPDAILSRAKGVETINSELLENIMTILSKNWKEEQEDGNIPSMHNLQGSFRRFTTDSTARSMQSTFKYHECFSIDVRALGTLLMLLVSNLLLSEKVASMPMNVSEAGRSEVSLKDLFDNATILSENITKLSTDMRMEFAKAIEAQHKILLEYIMKIVSKVNPALQEKEDSLVWSDLDLLQAADEESRLFALYVFSYCLRVDLQIVEFCIYMLRCLHMHGKICYIESAPSF
ncbi:prolactin family 7 subfamily c member 1 [Cricetulus griseus]